MSCEELETSVGESLSHHQFERMEFLCLSNDIEPVSSAHGKRNQFAFNEIPETGAELSINLVSKVHQTPKAIYLDTSRKIEINWSSSVTVLVLCLVMCAVGCIFSKISKRLSASRLRERDEAELARM